jgi:hypothetical protein
LPFFANFWVITDQWNLIFSLLPEAKKTKQKKQHPTESPKYQHRVWSSRTYKKTWRRTDPQARRRLAEMPSHPSEKTQTRAH